LFGGPQLSHSAGKYLPMHYISLQKAADLITLVMDGLSQESLTELLGLIQSKSKKSQEQ
jgi:hypothetical protein